MNRLLRISIVLVLIICSGKLHAQDDKTKIGIDQNSTQQGGYFNFGDKNKVNIEVNVLGYVRYPGKYLVPRGTTFQDLMAFCGGPTIDAKYDKIRLYRPKNDTLGIKQDKIIQLDYNDIFWEDKVSDAITKSNPILLPGDFLIFPGDQKLFFRDSIGIITSIASVLISLGILVLTISRSSGN